AGDRDRRRDVHRLRQRPRAPHHRRAAGAEREEHVRRDPRGRRARLRAQRARARRRASHRALEGTVSAVLNAPVVPDVPVWPFEPGPVGTHITIRGLTKYYAGWPLYEN